MGERGTQSTPVNEVWIGHKGRMYCLGIGSNWELGGYDGGSQAKNQRQSPGRNIEGQHWGNAEASWGRGQRINNSQKRGRKTKQEIVEKAKIKTFQFPVSLEPFLGLHPLEQVDTSEDRHAAISCIFTVMSTAFPETSQ